MKMARLIAALAVIGLTAPILRAEPIVGGGVVQRVKSEKAFRAAAGQMFYSSIKSLSVTATSETPIFLFVNLSTNTLTAYIYQNNSTNEDANASISFKIYSNPVVTSSGTSTAILTTSVGTSSTSKMQAFTSPTISSNGTYIDSHVTQARSTTSRLIDFVFIAKPGNTFLFTIQPDLVNVPVSLRLVWAEY